MYQIIQLKTPIIVFLFKKKNILRLYKLVHQHKFYSQHLKENLINQNHTNLFECILNLINPSNHFWSYDVKLPRYDHW